MRQQYLPNNDPISIIMTESNYGDDVLSIDIVDDTGRYNYINLQGANLENIDLEWLHDYVLNTYFDLHYRSSMYTAATLWDSCYIQRQYR